MELHTCTRFSQEPIKFFMFDKSAAMLTLMILIMQNMTSVVLFIAVNIIIKMMANRGLPLSMAIRKIYVKICGNVKPRFYPRTRRDHLFTN